MATFSKCDNYVVVSLSGVGGVGAVGSSHGDESGDDQELFIFLKNH